MSFYAYGSRKQEMSIIMRYTNFRERYKSSIIREGGHSGHAGQGIELTLDECLYIAFLRSGVAVRNQVPQLTANYYYSGG